MANKKWAERIPPHSQEAEQSTLGAAMASKDALADILEILQPEDFYDNANQEIYRAILDLFRESRPVDIVTVCDELKKRNALEAAKGRAYVASLVSDTPFSRNGAEYARIVSEKSSLRRLIRAAEQIQEQSFEESEETETILDRAEQSIFEIAQKKQQRDYSPLKDILLENIAAIEKAMQTQGQIIGLPTGYKRLDELTSGFQRSDLIILAARPAMGKTAFALNIALNAAQKANASVLIFSLEMSKGQLGQRLLAMDSKVEMQRLKTGKLERSDWDRIALSSDFLSKSKITIDDNAGVGVMEMKNKCRRLKAAQGLDLIIVDYLQLMKADGRADNRQQEISTLSRHLKLLAREMDCPVIVLSQLSRAPESRPDHRPVLSDLRESGSIEQDADMVIFLYRDDYYTKEESEKPGICEVNLAKHRSGPTDRVDLTWVERYTRFSDIGKGER